MRFICILAVLFPKVHINHCSLTPHRTAATLQCNVKLHPFNVILHIPAVCLQFNTLEYTCISDVEYPTIYLCHFSVTTFNTAAVSLK